jgi:signal transduction histidine kinase
VFRDATRRRQNEAALIESERQRLQAQRMEAVGRFAGGVAHDFNNLLTLINGYADLTLMQVDRSSPEREGIEEIRKAGERAASLTRQLLVFSRGQPVKLEVVDLNKIVANFEKMLRRMIGEDIELVTVLANESLHVRVDVGQIEQVIMNLAVNARDAMPGGGRMTLETGVEKPDESIAGPDPGEVSVAYAVLTVTDTGIGIDPQTKAHLF